MKPQQLQQYNPQQYAYPPPPTQHSQGKVVENNGMPQNNHAQPDALGRRGI
jgi:hypothetical protein